MLISIQNKAVEIICENKEKFGMSQIVIDRSIIEDYEGTPLFILEQYTSRTSIKCDISLNSVRSEPEPSNPPSPSPIPSPQYSSMKPSDTSDQDGNMGTAAHLVSKSKSGGLSSGTLAVIIISIIAAIAAIIVIIVLKRRGAFGSKKRLAEYNASASELKIN